MKKYVLLLSVIFIASGVFSQDYNISFAGKGAATTVDSIQVKNLKKGTSLSLLGTDVLHLIKYVGIQNLNLQQENAAVYPSPMKEQAELSFYVKEAGKTQITIYDISGKEITTISTNLTSGQQRFVLKGLKEGSYVVKVRAEQYQYIVKLTSLNNSQNHPVISYIGSVNPQDNPILKSALSTINMAFTTGDTLRYTGYSGIYVDVFNDVPSISKTITFTFVAIGCPATVTDIDGNSYNIVQIGTQCWMQKNLKVTRYRNGDSITNITNYTQWANLTTEAYCDYNNIASNSTIYGKLYNYFAVVDSRNICPTGWHVPSNVEWTILTTYLGGESVAAGKLKETGTTHWQSPNTGATNETGFTALPGGDRNYIGSFSNKGSIGFWWSSTEFNTNDGYHRCIYNHTTNFYSYSSSKVHGFSVRCIKDN
jgi:uncharacterized protein (TIGR02145 family)